MREIEKSEEFARDWDWYAVDPEGYIAHFTTAGMRPLPVSVKQDRDGAERLIRYFFEEAPAWCGWSVRDAVESDCGGWNSPEARERFLESSAEMSRKGLFSYDTQMIHGPSAKYYLVTRPDRPLQLGEVPQEIRNLLVRTRSQVRFREAEYIPEADTESW